MVEMLLVNLECQSLTHDVHILDALEDSLAKANAIDGIDDKVDYGASDAGRISTKGAVHCGLRSKPLPIDIRVEYSRLP